MSRIDRIEELLASPLAHDPDEHNSLVFKGMQLPPEELCWRCGTSADVDESLGICSECVADLRNPAAVSDPPSPWAGFDLWAQAHERLSETVQRVSALFAGLIRHGVHEDTRLRVFGVRASGEVDQFVLPPAVEWVQVILDDGLVAYDGRAFIEPVIIDDPPTTRRCDMHPDDICDGVVPCAVCVVIPQRVIEGCLYTDPEDGTCGHPNRMTPECWRAADGSRSDCPIAEVIEQWVTIAPTIDPRRTAGHLPFPGDRGYGGWAHEPILNTFDDEWPI